MPMSFGGISKAKVATIIVAADGSGDTTNIQTGINMLPAGGGAVYIKEGIYTVSSSITILKSNVRIEGAGFATEIKLGDSVDDDVLVVGDGSTVLTGITLSRFRINGNKSNNSSGKCIRFYGGNGYSIENSWISQIEIENGPDEAISLMFSDNTFISDCFISNCEAEGIYGVNFQGIISNNIIKSNRGSGIILTRIFWLSKLTIMNNRIIGNSSYGIWIDDGSLGSISANLVMNNGNSGIYFSSTCYNITIIGNVCRDDQSTATQDYGIDLYSCYRITCIGNVCGGNEIGQIRDNSSNSEVVHNITT